jgi:ubiquinol-cytochrome c reductase cytochrome c1 subunit
VLSQAAFDNEVADLLAFMQWMGEPGQSARIRLGAWVLIFLGLFIVLTWRLNAAYWKDVN